MMPSVRHAVRVTRPTEDTEDHTAQANGSVLNPFSLAPEANG